MKPSTSRSTAALRLAAVALALIGAASGASAQYKIVGPDGRVTYTDKPPAPSAIKPGTGATQPPSAGGPLPYETRQAAAKYPVALYAAKNCGPCDNARLWLRNRGVPYSEFSIESSADMTALQTRFGSATLPVVTVGAQAIKGFNTADLQSYVDAAGYPAQAHLAGYAWPAAVPLAPPSLAAAKPASAAAAPPPSAASRLPQPSNTGIQF